MSDCFWRRLEESEYFMPQPDCWSLGAHLSSNKPIVSENVCKSILLRKSLNVRLFQKTSGSPILSENAGKSDCFEKRLQVRLFQKTSRRKRVFHATTRLLQPWQAQLPIVSDSSCSSTAVQDLDHRDTGRVWNVSQQRLNLCLLRQVRVENISK